MTGDAPRAERPPGMPPGARLVRCAAGVAPESVRVALAARRWGAAELVKAERRAQTWLGVLQTNSGPRVVVLKRIPIGRGVGARARLAAQRTKATRQWHGARLLTAADIPCSQPLALFESAEEGGRFEWLLLGMVEGRDLIGALHEGGMTAREEHALAARAGELVRTLDHARLFNRDHKLSNLVRRPDGGLAVIDTVAVSRRRRHAGPERMLAAMLFEAVGTGLLPRRTLRARCVIAAVGRERWKHAWRRLEARLGRAGDTRPRVDPRPRRAASSRG